MNFFQVQIRNPPVQNIISTQNPKGGPHTCHKCGKAGHLAKECKVGDQGPRNLCYLCKKPGHKKDSCPSRNQPKLLEGNQAKKEKKCIYCGKPGHNPGTCRKKEPKKPELKIQRRQLVAPAAATTDPVAASTASSTVFYEYQIDFNVSRSSLL